MPRGSTRLRPRLKMLPLATDAPAWRSWSWGGPLPYSPTESPRHSSGGCRDRPSGIAARRGDSPREYGDGDGDGSQRTEHDSDGYSTTSDLPPVSSAVTENDVMWMSKPSRRGRRVTRCALMICFLAGGELLASCSTPLTFRQLSFDAKHLPVPQGVVFVKVTNSVEDGPGFTTAHSEQVTRTFENKLPCTILEARWTAELRRARRSFAVDLEPHLAGASGLSRITLNDRPENLGITLGPITNEGVYISCKAPFIWAFNSPH
jgi:hypothetical protein